MRAISLLRLDVIKFLYSQLFQSENIPERTNKAYSKLIYVANLLAEAREFLESTSYKGFDIIVDELVNPEVLQQLGEKYSNGAEFSSLERIIADVAILSGGIDNKNRFGKVNSESDFNENSFEKAE